MTEHSHHHNRVRCCVAPPQHRHFHAQTDAVYDVLEVVLLGTSREAKTEGQRRLGTKCVGIRGKSRGRVGALQGAGGAARGKGPREDEAGKGRENGRSTGRTQKQCEAAGCEEG